ncbi:GNAT family N-acetyltransferase [Geitlerinema splendidum]|jgi:GNAT superfamily N-acetyltransferase|nr:GNAT family N-acetyltransferase [Geitlerinema splendidum]
MTDIVVRAATPDDLPQLYALWREKWSLAVQKHKPEASRISGFEDWQMKASGWFTPSDCLYAASSGDRVVGFVHASVSPTNNETVIVDDLILDLHQYHPGAARQLFNALRQWCAVRDVRRLTIPAGRRMPVEIAFWRSVGAQPGGSSEEMENLCLTL